MIQSRLSVPRLLLMAAEVVTFVVLCIVATGHFGWSDGAKITAAFAVAYIVPSAILHRARGTSLAAQFILLLLAILLIYTDYGRLVYSSSFEGYSLAYPKLSGDGYLYYKYALSLYDSSVECEGVIFPGLSWFMLGLWKLFGLSEVWPYAMNMIFRWFRWSVPLPSCSRLWAQVSTARVSLSKVIYPLSRRRDAKPSKSLRSVPPSSGRLRYSSRRHTATRRCSNRFSAPFVRRHASA